MKQKIIVPNLDYEKRVEEICDFIGETVEKARADGVVIGLSGGVDSSLTTTLCVNALEKKRVMGVLMPTNFTPIQDVDDARELASWLGINTEFVNIQRTSGVLFEDLHINPDDRQQRMPMANIYARIRMIILYYYANVHNYLVVGTGDRSEALIGFFTKYGDGGADFFPIIHLYKTQVRDLAKHLGVPDKIAYKPSSPQLYPGHKATDEIPLDYDRLDPILVGLFDLELSPAEVSHSANVSSEIVDEVLRRFHTSKHKRRFPSSIGH